MMDIVSYIDKVCPRDIQEVLKRSILDKSAPWILDTTLGAINGLLWWWLTDFNNLVGFLTAAGLSVLLVGMYQSKKNTALNNLSQFRHAIENVTQLIEQNSTNKVKYSYYMDLLIRSKPNSIVIDKDAKVTLGMYLASMALRLPEEAKTLESYSQLLEYGEQITK